MSLAPLLRARIAPHFSMGAPNYDPCHDIFHLDRVARLAAHIAKAEGADAEVVACAAYLHDLDRARGSGDALDGSPRRPGDPSGPGRNVHPNDVSSLAAAHLSAVGASPDIAARVLEAVDRHKDKSFSAGGVRARSLEAAVLSDADKLEAIGAIGVARAFSYGGFKQRALWDGAPTVVPETYVSGAHGTTVQHFYDKLLRIRGDLVTPTARRMGDERHAFLETFLAEFFAEWEGAP